MTNRELITVLSKIEKASRMTVSKEVMRLLTERGLVTVWVDNTSWDPKVSLNDRGREVLFNGRIKLLAKDTVDDMMRMGYNINQVENIAYSMLHTLRDYRLEIEESGKDNDK